MLQGLPRTSHPFNTGVGLSERKHNHLQSKHRVSSIVRPTLNQGHSLRIHLWIFPVFTPSSPKWSVQMCRGSRTGAAISVYTSAALMMMPLDLLCSAIWALDPVWLRNGGIPRHAFLSWSSYVYTAGISCIQAHAVMIFCFSACTYNSSSKVKREHENVMKTVAGFKKGTLWFSHCIKKEHDKYEWLSSFRLGDGCWQSQRRRAAACRRVKTPPASPLPFTWM